MHAQLAAIPSRGAAITVLSSKEATLDNQIDELVQELSQLTRAKTLEVTLKIGELVTHRIFHGDLSALRARGRRDHSIRKLAAHPKLPFSPSALWRAIGIYELLHRFPQFRSSAHLGVTHYRAVLGLPVAVQSELLAAAHEQRWTGEHLQSLATCKRQPFRTSGRRAISGVEKPLRHLKRFLSEADRVCFTQAATTLTEDCLEETARQLQDVRQQLGELEQLLKTQLARVRTPSPVQPLSSHA
jgi:hypothetical protein